MPKPAKPGRSLLNKCARAFDRVRRCDKAVLRDFRLDQRCAVVDTQVPIEQALGFSDGSGRTGAGKPAHVVAGAVEQRLRRHYPIDETKPVSLVGSNAIAHPQQIQSAADACEARQNPGRAMLGDQPAFQEHRGEARRARRETQIAHQRENDPAAGGNAEAQASA